MALTQAPFLAQQALTALLAANSTLATYEPSFGMPPTPPGKSRVWVKEDIESWTLEQDSTCAYTHPRQSFDLHVDVYMPMRGATAIEAVTAIDPVIAAVRAVVGAAPTLTDTVSLAFTAEAPVSFPLIDGDGKVRSAQAHITVRCTAW